MTALGDPDETSKKTNPLTLRYGPLQLVFWSRPKQRNQDLREIVMSHQPAAEPLPDTLPLSDWNPRSTPTEAEFRAYLDRINCHPVHVVSGPSGTQLIFISGVVALFTGGSLHSLRLTQRDSQAAEPITVSDEREPSVDQIRGMLTEADHAMLAGAPRAALMAAWAGLEAALRRVAIQIGGQGRIGVQPSILLREVFAAGELTPDEHRLLEGIRQVRTAAAHGLASAQIDANMMHQLKKTTLRLLGDSGPSLRKRKEVAYISPVEAIEAFSVLANSKHYQSLADFFRSKGLRVNIEENAIGGDDPQHDIQIEKTISFDELNRLIDEWKGRP
jgi:hypothetical protein